MILRDTNDLESGVVYAVDEVGALGNKRADGDDGGSEERNERDKVIKKLSLRQSGRTRDKEITDLRHIEDLWRNGEFAETSSLLRRC